MFTLIFYIWLGKSLASPRPIHKTGFHSKAECVAYAGLLASRYPGPYYRVEWGCGEAMK